MPSKLSQFLGSFNCFRQKPQPTLVTSIPYEVESKGLRVSSRSIHSNDQAPTSTSTESTLHAPPLQIEVQQDSKSKSNSALVVVGKGQYELRESFPFPSLDHEREVVIRTKAVGLNPIDWKSVDYGFCLPEFPWITGREMAGVVEHVGSEVTEFHVGQRVWTSTYYKDRRAGCFQHFVTVPQHTVAPIPAGLSFEEASCLGVAGLTAAMTLWRWLQVPGSPRTETHSIPSTGYILIWGGSTVTAQFAIQLAVLGGLKVIAVTSSKTKALAEALGASRVVTRDGKSGDEIVAEIRLFCGDAITRAIDLVGPETAKHCLQALSRSQKSLFAPLAMLSSKAVVPQNISVETVEMKQFVLDPSSQAYSRALNKLVEEGRIMLPHIEVLDGGLDIIQHGLERIKKGDMAGKKVIVRMH
ncbi:hypothetical protein A1O1_08115 [Capronia coronata CBS 617.96]|uniref:Enoyl reductase (ER) domain-containing protein n=1 Tax=Capronia coronata CBS 617.96 TaxID=1182541 RepID=W9XYK3_9EURO|nr:uncharacterized protein A1O1_08115 [Capronia coronata CBS 617.96]EXJ82046.1 hypothetical protein A1O1_08115 [Capronia coronata CBS 617.96]